MEVTLQDVANQVTAISKQLEQFQGMERRLAEHVETHLNAAVGELKQQAQIYKEELKEEVRKGAEGYGGTLEGIQRELTELNNKVDTTFRDRHLVLADHNQRITKLEERR